MTGQRDPDAMLRDWLGRELGEVPQPERAVHEAIRLAARERQRRPRPSLRTWLSGRGRVPSSLEVAGPEVVLWAPDPRAAANGPAGSATAASPLPVSRLLVVLGLAVAMLAGLIAFNARLGPDDGLGAGPARPAPALVLAPHTGASREIIVDAAGSGHFWTIGEAVAAAVEGDVIKVKPGTYAESIVIDKDIDLVGDGAPEQIVLTPGSGEIASHDVRGRVAEDSPWPLRDGFGVLQLRSDGVLDITPTLLEDGWRFVLYLANTEARVAGLTLQGSEIGTAVVVRGGAPTLSGLVLDPTGEQRNKTAANPHEAVAIGGGSSAVLQDNVIRAFVTVGEGSRPLISGNTMDGACLMVGGAGSDPTVLANRFEHSECPLYSLWVMDGASPTIESNTFIGDRQTDGIKVTDPGSAPIIDGNSVQGGDFGIWIGAGAEGRVTRNNITGARTGIGVEEAEPNLSLNEVRHNEVGVSVRNAALSGFEGNAICDNGKDLDIGPDAIVPATLGVSCAGTSS